MNLEVRLPDPTGSVLPLFFWAKTRYIYNMKNETTLIPSASSDYVWCYDQLVAQLDEINEFINELVNCNGSWAGIISTMVATLTLNQDWELDGGELDYLEECLIEMGAEPMGNEVLTRALLDRRFDADLFDSGILIFLIEESGFDAEVIIDAAREIGVSEEVIEETLESIED